MRREEGVQDINKGRGGEGGDREERWEG